MDFWPAAGWGSTGGVLGVWLSWVAPDTNTALVHVPRSMRSGLWWSSTLFWIVSGGVFAAAAADQFGGAMGALWLLGIGIAAPWIPQRLVQIILTWLEKLTPDTTDKEDG